MKNPVARKLGMNAGMRALIIAPPPGYLKLLTPLPDGLIVSSRAAGRFPFVQVFATRLSEEDLQSRRRSQPRRDSGSDE